MGSRNQNDLGGSLLKVLRRRSPALHLDVLLNSTKSFLTYHDKSCQSVLASTTTNIQLSTLVLSSTGNYVLTIKMARWRKFVERSFNFVSILKISPIFLVAVPF